MTIDTDTSENSLVSAAPTRRLTIAKAMTEAIAQEMRADSSIIVLGEDVGKLGGVFATTQGLFAEFGPDRVCDTPISESAFIGAAVGMATSGMRPIVEMMFVDFFGVCMNSIYNVAAKNCYFSGGSQPVPMVLMTSVGGGYSDGGEHSQVLYGTFAHLPGMKVVIPSNAYDAKGLMSAAINDANPVIFMFHKALQGMGWLGTVRGSITDVPIERYEVPIGQAAMIREGADITLVGLGITVHHALEAASELQEKGISAEVIDLRTVVPLDRDRLVQSIRKTGRLIVVDDDYQSFGVASEIMALASELAFKHLRSAPARVAHPDVPIPFSPVLERHLLPSSAKIVAAAEKMIRN